MTVRKAEPRDLDAITDLFYHTINKINSKDYSPEQVAQWSAGAGNHAGWLQRITDQEFLLAESENELVGFASMATTGYVDLCYVHHLHQSKGIATLLLDNLEGSARTRRMPLLTVHASITARPFFEKRGYIIIEEQTRQIGNTTFTNYFMRKEITA